MQSSSWGALPSLDALLAGAFGPETRRSIDFAAGKTPLRLVLYPPGLALKSPLLMMCLAGTIGDDSAELYVSRTVLDACVDDMAPGLSDAALEPNLKSLIVEAALAEPLDELEKRIGARIQISTVTFMREKHDGFKEPNVVFNIAAGKGTQQTAYARVSPAIERKLIALWSGRVDGDETLDPQLTVAVRVGRIRLTTAAVDELTPDDVLVFDESPLAQKRLCLIISERLAAQGELDGKSFFLAEPIGPMDGSWNARLSAADGATAGNGSRSGEHEVTLVADLVRRRLALSQLLSIDMAGPIDLPRRLEDTVDLYHGRKLVASGQIVRVGTAMGLRISKVASND